MDGILRKRGTKNGWRYRKAIFLYRTLSCRYNAFWFNEQPDFDEQDVTGDNADVPAIPQTHFDSMPWRRGERGNIKKKYHSNVPYN